MDSCVPENKQTNEASDSSVSVAESLLMVAGVHNEPRLE